MIALNKVSKTFGEKNKFEVLRDISLTVPQGKFICILGPSGAGKSILLELIAGFYPPTSGTITMHQQPITGPDTRRIMMFQNYMLFPWKTVYQNILFGLQTASLSKKEKDHKVWEQLALVGLKDFAHWYTHKLSGGMQQRVALARALISDPDVLLMDEPFAALDSQYRAYLRETLLRLWQKTKKTIIFVTHSVNEAITLADVIYLFSARPAQIKKTFIIDSPRPRPLDSKSYSTLYQSIENILADEFQKTINQIHLTN